MHPMDIFKTVQPMRAWSLKRKAENKTIAFVPTMGALHEGHFALIRHAQTLADRVVVSIFVNPKQFAPHEDLSQYPRQQDKDLQALSSLNADAVFLPREETVYPIGNATHIVMQGPPAEGLESDFRPHFFSGVATVVSRLFHIICPDIAVFGEKDFQQLQVIRRMVQDLHLPVKIEGSPTIRESDGLALSSRNVYLSSDERKKAIILYEAMINLKNTWTKETPANFINDIKKQIEHIENKGFKIDYLQLADQETLRPVKTYDTTPKRLLVAAWLGKTRLIDNIAL
jgi:pantoate--beta-alanine ligase